MAGKYKQTSQLAAEQALLLTENPENYLRFLTTAANNYKYRFRDQLLIHAQRPDATACAEIEVWNRMRRWVNKGAKGIALLRDDDSPYKLRYVFDVSDTNSRAGAEVRLWKLEQRYEADVLEALQNQFGEVATGTFAGGLFCIAGNIAEDNCGDYGAQLLVMEHGESAEDALPMLTRCSVCYMLLHRCGIDPSQYFSAEDFKAITTFDTAEKISVLGTAVSTMSEMALRQIEGTVKALQREEERNRTFANPARPRYDEPYKNEGSKEYGTDLQERRRLSDSESERTGESEVREVRDAETALPSGASGEYLHGAAADEQAEPPSGRNRPAGGRDDEPADEGNGEDGGRDGEHESLESDGMGAENERHSEPGGGNGSDGADLQLSDPLPTVEEQQNTIQEAEAEKASAFAISQEEIDAVLTRGSGVSGGKLRIYEQYLKKESAADNIKMLKEEYGIGGSYPAARTELRELHENHDAKGINISTRPIGNPDAEILLSWAKVEKRIGELIAVDRYLNSKEKEAYPAYVREKETRAKRNEIASEFQSLIRDYNDYQEQLANKEALLNQYVLSNCAVNFTAGQKTTWALRDNNFILPLMREALNKIIAENTHHRERAEALLIALAGELAAPLEPTYDEQNPPPPPKKEYRFSLGDIVYIGAQEYDIISLDGETVVLYDPSYPLFNKEFSRAEFEAKVKGNPLNDKYLVAVDAPEPTQAEQSEEQAQELINEFCQQEYHENADFSDPFHVGIAYSTTEDSEHDIEVHVSIPEHRITFLVDREVVATIQCKDGEDFNDYLSNMEFGDLIGFAEVQWKKTKLATENEQQSEILTDEELDQLPVSVVENGEVVTYPNAESLLSAQETAPLPPPEKPKKVSKLPPCMIHPEIHSENRRNNRIHNDTLGVGTPSERYYHNILAIELLKKLETEGRLANELEQDVLSDYVGWGGLSDCFEEKSSHYLELKSLLTDEEYASARESTLTAFYTPPVVIKAIYQGLANLGFQRGNILEPSCGVGNFMGLLPDAMSDSRMYGVELDSISGRIAQQLYQKNSIAVQGYEKTELPDSFFDAAVGNVPFGQFKVPDKRYDKHNFLIHDYFFARTLDKVRPGGVIAFITSKGTMDKENSNVRKYIAQRADLIGAVRLPDNTFKSAAGTEVTSDIIFLQKRDSLVDLEPDWVHLGISETGVRMNQYFIDHPEMILGEMKEVSGPFGPETACVPYENADLKELLDSAVQNIHGQIWEYEAELPEETEDASIPADPTIRNFSYAVVDGKIYYRENSLMHPAEVSATGESRIKGLIEIRDSVRQLIEYQTEDYPDSMIQEEQEKLNRLYDAFTVKYGRINTRANTSAFSSDSSFCLLCSLEVLDDEGNFKRKADMFSKRTIKQRIVVTAVDTASEALTMSLSEKAGIDMEYMTQLTGKPEEELYADLRGVIFLNPLYSGEHCSQAKYLPADEYLSGNVREKLVLARKSADLYPDDYNHNVEALEAVQPKDLSASEIAVRMGATWVPQEMVEEFVFGLFDTPYYCRRSIHIRYSEITGEWRMDGKSYDRGNVKANSTYGSDRINGYKIVEDTLNLKDVRIFDYVEDGFGNKTAVLNKKETAIAQGKQELIKQEFQDWIWSDPERRETLTRIYNERFNSVRPREYDGSHLNFVGINPEISLRPHQVNAIAHILYGGNTLLAHVVGGGKTFEIVAAAQESKRLGLCQKSLIVVPNHLISQWASEYLQLYPSANILVATKKDFETRNRKKFCARIATGDFDAIIIGHSQFEKIPLSLERQRMFLEQQLDEILDGIQEIKQNHGDRLSVKQLEKTRKSIQLKLDKLNDQSRKDDVVTFEELGVDRLFVDEAHLFKNVAVFSKMRNVAGISQTEAQKSSDLYLKCRYLDELTGGKGVVFATGTPVSNSMCEMYTMQKYLQYSTLKRNGLVHFDAWASTFGETVTAIELDPAGSGFRAKTRFAKFYNLPELMAMFKEVADVQTADMLKLPVPEAYYETVALKPSEMQKQMMAELSERAERVRNKMVSSNEDNMLVITNDGRKLALDQRLMNPMLPDSGIGKTTVCADKVYEIWERTAERRSTQMIFSDLSTPNGKGFNVYDDLRDKLIAKGIPAEEIAYIHTANSEAQKKELFGKVRSGQIRILLGSTAKMGAGTNCQAKLIALHHIDTPWRPADLQQREGRIIRQGNENPCVEIYTYVTEGSFDSYIYQLVENKQKFIGQIMTSKSPVRSAEDIDETALSYAEIKALCTGNPMIKEKMELDTAVAKLKLLKANHLSQRYALEDQINKEFPRKITALEQRIEGYLADMTRLEQNTEPNKDGFSPMYLHGGTVTEKKAAGEGILGLCKSMTSPDPIRIGEYRGFDMELSFDSFSREYRITLIGALRHMTPLGTDIFGNIQRLDNLLDAFPARRQDCIDQLENTKVQLQNAQEQVQKPFPKEAELKEKTARLDELNILLNMDKRENEIVDDEKSEEAVEPERSNKEYER